MVNAFIYIATLGPSGTDSERAAIYYGNKLGKPYQLDLRRSFDNALQMVRSQEASFGIVPAAYKAVDDDLFRLHVRNRDLVIVEAFPLATKEMCLGKKPGTEEIRRVALHPTTDSLCPPGVEKLYIHSKPLCVEAVVKGEADAAIGSVDVMRQYGLEIAEGFGEIPMTWEVFRKRTG